jgi:hypothetical protein
MTMVMFCVAATVRVEMAMATSCVVATLSALAVPCWTMRAPVLGSATVMTPIESDEMEGLFCARATPTRHTTARTAQRMVDTCVCGAGHTQ